MSSLPAERFRQQANLVQVFGRDRQRDGIADGFVEAVIGAVLEQERLILVGALVEVVAEFVVNGDEVFAAHLDAHLDAQIVFVVDVPGAGVADDIAVGGLGEQRALPECWRQRREAQRGEEAFAVLHHAVGVEVLRLQQFGDVVGCFCLRRSDQREDVAPLLRPGIAEQVRGDRAVGGTTLGPYFSTSFART